MFQGLADFVVRRYKLIIVAWIVVIFFVFPLMFRINSVVVYNENEVGLNKLEAVEAGNIISEQFPGHLANSTITVVIQNSDMGSPEARAFASGLYDNITRDSALKGIIRVDYLYSAVESYLQGVTSQVVPALNSLYVQVNSTASLVYGMPVTAAQKYIAYQMQGANATTATSLTLQSISAELAAAGQNSSTINFTLGYVQTFFSYWNGTLTQSYLGQQISAAAGAYFPNAGQTGQFALAVLSAFNLGTFNSQIAQQAFAGTLMASQTGASAEFMALLWSLGPTPTADRIAEFARSVVFSYPLEGLPIAVPEPLIGQFLNTHTTSGSPNTTMLMAVSLDVASSSKEASDDVRELRSLAKDQKALNPGYQVYVSGDPAVNVDTEDAVATDTSKIDPATVILILLFVGLFFRSLVSPIVPLMTVGLGYVLATSMIYILGLFVMHIHYSVMTFVLVVMLGAGSDYCIFIMSRYREERVRGRPKEEAVKTSLTWAGESIATSGATVMIGFGALMIGQYSLVKSMGMALVVAVGTVLALSLTMLPAMLMLIGDRIFWPNKMLKETERAAKKEQRGGGYFRKSAHFSLKHSKAIVIAALVIVVPATIGVISMHSSYDFLSSLPNAESKLGVDALAAGFGKGTIMPTYVVLTYDSPVVVNGALVQSAAAQLEAYSSHLETMNNIRSVSGPTRPFGTPVNDTYLASLPPDQQATYLAAIASTFGKDNSTIMMTVVLQDEPFSTKSIQTIDDIRAYDKEAESQLFGGQAHVLVGGSTASTADVSRTVSNDFFTMRFLVMIGIYVVLLFVLGSLIIPLRLIGTVLLNVAITISMTMLVFEFVKGVPVLWLMPLILFVVALGLGMDYDIFLTTRIREEVSKGRSDDLAIVTSVERTGGIITACGLVMGGAFASMLLSSTALLQEFGFGLAFAIFLDAMILRIYLVPAIMLLLQKWNWYAPGRLQRVRKGERARKH